MKMYPGYQSLKSKRGLGTQGNENDVLSQSKMLLNNALSFSFLTENGTLQRKLVRTLSQNVENIAVQVI